MESWLITVELCGLLCSGHEPSETYLGKGVQLIFCLSSPYRREVAFEFVDYVLIHASGHLPAWMTGFEEALRIRAHETTHKVTSPSSLARTYVGADIKSSVNACLSVGSADAVRSSFCDWHALHGAHNAYVAGTG